MTTEIENAAIAPQVPRHVPPPDLPPLRASVPTLPSAGTSCAGFDLPRDFRFGAATSAHQVEGGCVANDWWAWEQAGRVREASGAACDHYHRFREDFDIARDLGHDMHRLSIEWSRIEPAPGVVDEAEVLHYREVLQALRERGIEPMVTLHHFTLPAWLAERGGWENPGSIAEFARFTRLAADAFGDLVRWWITINEPVAYVLKGYLLGEWPPGRTDFGAAIRVLRNMLHAHVAAWRELHARRPDAQVSIAHHGLALRACEPRRFRDRLSVGVRGHLCNRLFVDGLVTGRVRLPGLMWERLAQPGTLDFLGLNYYTRDFVHHAGFDLRGLVGGACGRSHRREIGMTNALGWEIYPEGLGELFDTFSRHGLPVLVTENGTCTESDTDRGSFMFVHLWQVVRALGRGVPVIGYLYWSLLDNYEWAHGFGPRFGLVRVDYATQERRIRRSAWVLSALVRRLPAERRAS